MNENPARRRSWWLKIVLAVLVIAAPMVIHFRPVVWSSTPEDTAPGGKTSGQNAGLPIMLLSLSNGSGEAIWEWIGPPQPSQIQTLQFGVVLAMAQSVSLPAAQTATVRLSLGPLSATATASASDPIPRFVDNEQPQSAFTVL